MAACSLNRYAMFEAAWLPSQVMNFFSFAIIKFTILVLVKSDFLPIVHNTHKYTNNSAISQRKRLALQGFEKQFYEVVRDMKIVCDDRIPFLRGVFGDTAECVYLPGAETGRGDLIDADAVITRTRTLCGPKLLEGTRVRFIASATIGTDHIDKAWCAENGIAWSNAPGCNSGSVRQYIASALCVLKRRHSLDFSKLTLGVVGVGNVGSKVADLGRTLGMRVLLCDPPRAAREGGEGFTDLDTLWRGSDIVSLHVPLEREGLYPTVHLIDSKRLGSDGNRDKILINSSRGAVVDNAALREALEAGRLRAAVLDVWENEPDIDLRLLQLVDIATPHIAGYSADGKARGTMMAVRAVAEALDLPRKDWSPAGIPEPEGGLVYECEAGEDLVEMALLASYDILADDAALRAHPENFEYLRGHYPVRREAPAWTLRLHGADEAQADVLRKLGFGRVITL